jgi:FADH2 O2-dependent halogenase
VSASFDVAVIGSGFAGSLAALLARRAGRSVILVERGSHPRFAIGESSSPLANLLLEGLCDKYDLPRVRPLAAWGTWQRERPEVGCGLKRGFTFYGHEFGRPFAGDPERRDQLLVAASPDDEVADTHWYRPDFDHFLAGEAQAAGADYLDLTELNALDRQPEAWSLRGARRGKSVAFRARFLIDASGPGGFLHRALALPPASFSALAADGLYTHFRGVRRLDDIGVFPSAESPPYPIDDAAVHHVFAGGWIWVLRFNNGITSAGVAARPELARQLRLSEGEAAWNRLLALLPTVREQFADSRRVLPFLHRPALPFRSRTAAGPDWALLPSAAAFVDPLLSTGFPLTLLGLERIADAMESCWATPAFATRIDSHGRRTLFEADTAALLVAALYARFDDFEVFAALTLLYFAAASFSEAARRLGRPELSGSFLSGDHPVFGPAFRSCCAMALERRAGDGAALLERIREAIAPFDVIGLLDRSRRNWYTVEARDLLDAAPKLHATRAEIEELLARMVPASVIPAPTSAGVRSR